jgi:hypothetical protein
LIALSRATRPRLRRLDHLMIAVKVHDRLIAQRFGLYGNTVRPAATISD